MNEYLKSIFLDSNGKMFPQKTRESYLRNHGLYELINNKFDDTYTLTEKIYCSIYECTKPKCKICGKYLEFKNGYNTYCSRACVNKDPLILEKNKNGVSISLKKAYQNRGEDIKKKRKDTLCKTYNENVNSPFAIKEVQTKIKETLKSKYGVENVFYLKDFRSKPECLQNKSVLINKNNGYDIEYVGTKEILVKNICDKHPIVQMDIINFYNRAYRDRNGIICPICNPISSFSSLEKNFENVLLELGITNYIKNTKKIITPLELDFYFPDNNIAIELNGIYWHSEINVNKNYHKNKTELCQNKAIQLIHIWEDDFYNKQDIIKSMLNIKFNKCKTKIYARDCQVKEIKPKTYRDFLNQNHLQQQMNSSIRYGLFYNNELISVMGFGKPRLPFKQQNNNNYEYELQRFATKLNTIIIGGASKLLSYFEKQNKYTSIISYAKRDHSNGNLYTKLGFKLNSICEPGYYWVIDNKRKHRFNYRKDKIVNEQNKHKSAIQIMHDNGYYRCYDSGNLKFIKQNFS